jgi:hypothetical protein
MPEAKEIVINTSPLLALIAGLGSLNMLKPSCCVPYEVCEEIFASGQQDLASRNLTRQIFCSS